MSVPATHSVDIKKKSKTDRQPSSNVSGSPKKGGAGGKGTWGVGGLDDLKIPSIDRDDPNYDSEDEEAEDIVLAPTLVVRDEELKAESAKLESILDEYFSSGEVSDVITSLEEIRETKYPHFVKKLLVKAMDRDAPHREMASKLISKLGTKVPKDSIQLGFQMTIDALEDVSLDLPDAPSILSKFIARAVFDEVIPPAFLGHHAKINNEKADMCLRLAKAFSNERFRSEKLAHVWGPGDLSSIKRLRKEANMIFSEYLTNGDFQEASLSLRNLKAPDFHFQVVREGIRVALENEGESRNTVLSLLKKFSESALISSTQFGHGFETCFKTIDDLLLDYPNAAKVLPTVVEKAKQEGWLDKDFTPPSQNAEKS